AGRPTIAAAASQGRLRTPKRTVINVLDSFISPPGSSEVAWSTGTEYSRTDGTGSSRYIPGDPPDVRPCQNREGQCLLRFRIDSQNPSIENGQRSKQLSDTTNERVVPCPAPRQHHFVHTQREKPSIVRVENRARGQLRESGRQIQPVLVSLG